MKRRTLSILLVEDSLDHAELVRRSFQQHNLPHRIEHVQDGESALDYLDQFKQTNRRNSALSSRKSQPDLVLLDLRIPKIDGMEVLKEIRRSQEFSGMPVVVLTTSYNPSDIELAYKNHANSYLVKPVDFNSFSSLMRDLGLYWLSCNIYPD